MKKNHHTDSEGKNSREESPTTRADYTGQGATVEENHRTDSQKGKAPEKKVQQHVQITQDKEPL